MTKAPAATSNGLPTLYVASAGLLAATLLLTIPGRLFLGNLGEFTIGTLDLLLFLLPMFGLAMAIAAAAWFVIPRRARPAFVAVVFALAILVWLQGNVLVWDYGPLDGRAIAWNAHATTGLIDGAIWLAVIAGSVLLLPRLSARAVVIFPAIILAVAIVQLTASLFAQPAGGTTAVKNFSIDDSGKFRYSQSKNIILIVMDEMQSDVFDEVTRDPRYHQVFEGFTYFPNALAGSNFTQLAIPSLLTGAVYDNSLPRGEFNEQTFLEFGITTVMKRSGFDVGVYPWIGWGNEAFFFHEDVGDNLVDRATNKSDQRAYSERNAKDVLHLIDLTLFRSAPQFLKRHIYNDQRWFVLPLALSLVPESMKQAVSNDNRYETNVFVREALDEVERADMPATFRYYHIKGAHQPLSVNADLEFTDAVVPFNRANYIASIKANIRELGRFLDKLKVEGLFEQSLIVVVGDHGSGNTADVYVRPQGEAPADGADHTFQKQKARGIPLVLIKRMGGDGPMQRNEAPVSLMDIPATILAETGVTAPATGRSMFTVASDENRTRTYVAFDYRANRSDYVGTLTVYEVTGHSWLDESWTVAGLKPPGGEMAAEQPADIPPASGAADTN